MRRFFASAFVTATLIACSATTFPTPTDDGGADGAATDGSADGRFPGACTPDGGFPSFVKGCTTVDNCVFKLHQLDCCGSMLAIGMNHAEAIAFDKTELEWRTACPKCACPSGPTVAEDGKTGPSLDVKLTCDGNVCKTTF